MERLGIEFITNFQATLIIGALLGCAFGALAQVTRFCFRRALIGEDKWQAGATWAMALAVATIGVQLGLSFELFALEGHRLFPADLPLLAIVLGGVLFGTGAVLTRGCASRLTVLAAGGNLRAVVVLVTMAIVALATMKGVLAPLRTFAASFTIASPTLVIPPAVFALALLIGAGLLVWKARLAPTQIVLAALLGALFPAAWVATGWALLDEFDPIPVESLSFTGPIADTLFWTVAATSIPPNFGISLFGGTLAGAALLTLIRKEFAWQGFEKPSQMGRYLFGGALMGFGGVLAGGCTIGAGLAGVPTLSVAAILALGSIAAGVVGAHKLLSGTSRESFGHSTKLPQQPAE